MVEIQFINKIKEFSDFAKIHANIKSAFSKIKEEFDDHLVAINQNTDEIQANYEYIQRVESKLDKLAESIEHIAILLRNKQGGVSEDPDFRITPLTKREKEVFQALYTIEDEKGRVMYSDIAGRLAIAESLVMSYITNLAEKGIPIVKKYVGRDVHIRIDPSFRNLQAKKNIVGINHEISRSVVSA